MADELFCGQLWTITKESASLPDGRVKTTERAARPDSVHLIAFVRDDRVLLLHEYRPFYKTYIWMLPSGKADKETDIEVAAQRELQEETGYRAGEITLLWKANNSEDMKSTNYFFLARQLQPSSLPQDDDELIEVEEVSVEDAIDRVLKSPIVHTPSACGLLRYAREHGL